VDQSYLQYRSFGKQVAAHLENRKHMKTSDFTIKSTARENDILKTRPRYDLSDSLEPNEP
jgi:hypothetical protein